MGRMNRMGWPGAALGLAAGTLLCASNANAGFALAESTFDTDSDGWGVYSDALNFEWVDDFGNGAGSIHANDDVSGVIWGFTAGSHFLGNKSAAYGGTLSWQIFASHGSNIATGEPDLELVGSTMSLVLDLTPPTAGEWFDYSITLDETTDWRINTIGGTVASATDIQSVLGNLLELRIRAEYRSGADNAYLDNVIMTPAPGALALIGLAGVAARRRRRN